MKRISKYKNEVKDLTNESLELFGEGIISIIFIQIALYISSNTVLKGIVSVLILFFLYCNFVFQDE